MQRCSSPLSLEYLRISGDWCLRGHKIQICRAGMLACTEMRDWEEGLVGSDRVTMAMVGQLLLHGGQRSSILSSTFCGLNETRGL